MSTPFPLVRVFVKGGLISPADLLRTMDASRKFGNSYIMFGSRQDILFPAAGEKQNEIAADMTRGGIEFNLTDSRKLKDLRQPHNLVSSYVGVNITDTTWWLKEDVYHSVLESFDYQPAIKVNIIDPLQSLVPLFTGHLNFISSRNEHYWFLYIKRKGENAPPECWPTLIHGTDIARLTRELEKSIEKGPERSIEALYKTVADKLQINRKRAEEKLRMPTALFPYYEGLNVMQNNLFWLGLYWRNNRFDIDFLSAACRLCQKTTIGKISITPWKSFIIKGIRSADRVLWEKLMGKYGINLRHSSLELNWHIPVMDEEAMELKSYLVRQLVTQDISTHGLTFSIKNSAGMLLFTSVVIEKNPEEGDQEGSYNILYAKDFNPNHSVYISFARQVKKSRLPDLLIQLSKIYFKELASEKNEKEDDRIKSPPDNQASDTLAASGQTTKVRLSSYQCSDCLTIYDKKYGDPEAGIRPGIPFDELPEDYFCSLCGNMKKNFLPLAGQQ